MKFKNFKPATSVATQKITELISRGGKLIKDSATKVEIKRLESIATIDDMGRVEWRPAK